VGFAPVTPRSVWILRHAKAEAGGLDDHSRALTGRGRRQAAEVGDYLASAPVDGVSVPHTVLCSSARRAQQTAELVIEHLTGRVNLVVEPALYGADPDAVLEQLRLLDDEVSSVLVVGHNPTLQELAVLLLDDAPSAASDRRASEPDALERFPTAALAVEWVPAVRWGELALGTGRLLDVHIPPS
jgi:phosphohistidine phosphatase